MWMRFKSFNAWCGLLAVIRRGVLVERTKTLLPGDKAGALEQVSPIQSPPLITRATPQCFLVSTPCVCNYDRRTHGQSQRRKVLRMTLQALIFAFSSENCMMVTSESLKFWQTGENVCRQPPQGLCNGLALPWLSLCHHAALTPCLPATSLPTQQCSQRSSSQILSANVPQHCGPPQMFSDHIVWSSRCNFAAFFVSIECQYYVSCNGIIISEISVSR